jgi:hypothetical protein
MAELGIVVVFFDETSDRQLNVALYVTSLKFHCVSRFDQSAE